MKKLILILLLMAFQSSFAQWKDISGSGWLSYINSIENYGDTVYVSTRAGLYITTDLGETWLLNSSMNTDSALGIACILSYSNNLYIGMVNGVYLSQDNGDTWQYKSNGLDSSDVYVLGVSGNMFYAWAGKDVNGVEQYRLYRSTDKGDTWELTSLFDTNSSNFFSKHIITMGDTVFIGWGSHGVYMSTDNGKTWIDKNNGFPNLFSITDLAKIESKIFAGTTDGVYISSDNGESWIQKVNGLHYNTNTIPIDAINVDSVTNNIYAEGMYLITLDYDKEGFYMSSDLGESWVILDTGYTNERIPCILPLKGKLFSGLTNNITTSTDNGTTWENEYNGIKNNIVSALFVSNDKIIAGIGNSIYISTDDGTTWKQNKIQLSGAISKKAFYKFNNTIFVSTADGIYASTDDGLSWQTKNNGLSIDTYSIASDDSTHIFAGTQSNGIFVSTDGGNNWQKTNINDTVGCVYSMIFFENAIYAATYTGIYRSTDWGNSWNLKNNGIQSVFGYIMPIFSQGSDYLAIGDFTGNIYISTDNGDNWTIKPINGNYGYYIMSIATLGGNNIIVSTKGHGLFLSTNRGDSWVEVNDGLGSNNLIAYDFNVKGDSIYAAISGVYVATISDLIKTNVVKENLNNEKINFNLFPNPVSDYLSIDTKDIYYNQLINIYNVYGQKILECPYSDKIDVSNLLPGAYYFRLADKTIKFIKQ